MSRDGAGNYTLPSGNPVVTNTVISSTWANNTLSDVGAALTQSLSKDGQTTPTADLTMGNFKLRNLANALARTDAVTAGQIQDGGLVALSSVSGTDTIAASSAPAITTYVAGQRFTFLPSGANATTTVTLNINAIGAKSVLKPTQAGLIALAAGDIAANVEQTVIYDGTQFQLQTPSFTNLGRLLNVQTFIASGTYTNTPGTTSIIVEATGGGGGGGGSGAQGATTVSMAGGGGGGAFAKGRYTTGFTGGITVTIGAAGTAASAGANAGGAGGTTSLGSIISAAGGGGGTAGASVTPVGFGSASGNRATQPTLGNIINQGGAIGQAGFAVTASVGVGGTGASGPAGGGTAPVGLNSGGIAANGYGVGGGGGATAGSGAAQGGGVGGQGLLVIWEYS